MYYGFEKCAATPETRAWFLVTTHFGLYKQSDSVEANTGRNVDVYKYTWKR